MAERSTENEVLVQQREVEEVIPRLEAAAQTTGRALDEVSSHWDAVYRAMRRADRAPRGPNRRCFQTNPIGDSLVVVNKTITAVTVSL
jgi:hypothetical protein